MSSYAEVEELEEEMFGSAVSKREKKRMQNRESAMRSRMKKKNFQEQMEVEFG